MKLEQWKNSTLKNYLKKHKPKKSEVKHVLDYLTKHPKERLQRASYPQILAKSLQWVKTLNKKNANLKEAGQTEVLKNFPGGYQFVRLLDQTARDWEGKQMSHCVASYGDEDEIYSLRDVNNIPHVTFEITNGQVVQMVGKANSLVSEKYLDMALAAVKDFDLSEELMEDTFFTLPKRQLKFLTAHFTAPKSYLINHKPHYVHQTKLTLLKPFTSNSLENFELFSYAHFNCLEAVKLFLKNQVALNSIHTSTLIAYEVFSKENLIELLVAHDYSDPHIWSQLNYHPISQKNKKLVEHHLKGPIISTVNKKSFILPAPSPLKNPIEKADPAFIKFLIKHRLSESALLSAAKNQVLPELNKDDLYYLEAIALDNHFEILPRNWVSMIKKSFTGYELAKVGGRYFIKYLDFKMKADFTSDDLQFAQYLLKRGCSKALAHFMKGLASISYYWKGVLVEQAVKNQDNESLEMLLKFPAVPGESNKYCEFPYNCEQDVIDGAINVALNLKDDFNLIMLQFLLKFGKPSKRLKENLYFDNRNMYELLMEFL